MLASEPKKSLATAAAQAGMSENTARKYLKEDKLPSQLKKPHTWRTRKNPFKAVWAEIKEMLGNNPGLQAKTLFQWLQREHPGEFADGQLRTLQRHIKYWRATEGPAGEVIFPQQHHPGDLCQSDFVTMKDLQITITGKLFLHLLYHFALTYSNWEDITLCYSESFESLSTGLQNALWKLGGVPCRHRSDNLSAAVRDLNSREKEAFTSRYAGLLSHYGMAGEHTNPDSPHENGDVEQAHNRLVQAIDQSLMLRGSRDFESISSYEKFLRKVVKQLNSARQKRFAEDTEHLRSLPEKRLSDCKRIQARVRKSSTIRADKNIYSVHSRLIGEQVNVRLSSTDVQIYYGQKKMHTHPRLRGSGKSSINYRHIIDSLVRKPGAFANYRYQPALFPGTCFRIAYDSLTETTPKRGLKDYLQILHKAAFEGEKRVQDILKELIRSNKKITVEAVTEQLKQTEDPPLPERVQVGPVELSRYDSLLQNRRVS